MILENLKVQNWRRFLNPMEIDPFDQRLNVIYAPNGTDKSSLFEALRRGLLDAYHSKADGIKAIKPWRHDLSPTIEVRFSHDGARYLLKKGFLHKPSSLLLREEEYLLKEQQQLEEARLLTQDARSKREKFHRKATELHEAIATARREEEYSQVQNEWRELYSIEASAHEQYEVIERNQRAREEINELEQTIIQGQKLVEQLTQEQETARQTETAALEQLNRDRHRQNELTESNNRINAARNFLHNRESYDQLTDLLKTLSGKETNFANLKKQRSALVAPNAQQVKNLRQWIASRDQADKDDKDDKDDTAAAASLQASLIHLTIRPIQDAKAQEQNSRETQPITGGESITFSGSPEVAVEVEGFGSIRAADPEGDAEKHQQTLFKAENQIVELTNQIAELTQPYDTDDPNEFQILSQRATDLDKEIERTKGSIQEQLDQKTVNQLRQEHAKLKADIDATSSKYPTWQNKCPTSAKCKTNATPSGA